MLTENDSISLEAFLTMFVHLDQPLDEVTEQALIEVIENLKDLANKNPLLKEQYEKERVEILKNYSSQSRKFINPHPQSVAERPEKTSPHETTTAKRHYKRKPGLHPGAFIISDDFDEPLSEGQVKHSILELEGLGKELWQGMDAQQYVDQERDSWNG
jgi:hypothetical protein